MCHVIEHAVASRKNPATLERLVHKACPLYKPDPAMAAWVSIAQGIHARLFDPLFDIQCALNQYLEYAQLMHRKPFQIYQKDSQWTLYNFHKILRRKYFLVNRRM